MMANRFRISTVFNAVDNMTRPVRRMTGSIQDMTMRAEAGLRNIDAATSKVSSGMFSLGSKGVKSAAGLTAALVVGSGAINQMKVEQDNMTRALGGSVKTVEAVSGAIKGIGLDSEAVTDLYEEMNNKFGESAGIEELAPVTEALGILGLQFKDMQDLSPDEQFLAITDAALKMEDATQAAAAADILMGGEANKVISAIRQKYSSTEEMIAAQEKLNFRTDESRRGAEAMAKAQSKSMTIIGSLTQQISGLIGKAMGPMIDKFNEFMINNKDLINQNLNKLFDSIGSAIGDITPHLKSAVKWIGNLGENFNEAITWAKWIGGIAASIASVMVVLNVFVGVMTAVNMVMAMNPAVLMGAAFIALGAAIAFIVSDIYDFINGNDSLIEGFLQGYPKITALVMQIGSAIGAIASVVMSVGSVIFDVFSGVAMVAIDGFVGGIKSILGLFDSAFGLIEGLGSALFAVFDSPTKALNILIDTFKTFVTDVLGSMPDITGSLSEYGNAAMDYLGFGDDEEKPMMTEETASPQQRAQATMSETISRTISESRETVDINVTGQEGAQVSSPVQSPRLNLINTAS